MRKLLLSLALVLFASPALAQNTTCSDRPTGDSSNACANTRFVHKSLPTPGGINGDIQYNNNGSFGGLSVVDVPRGGTGASSFISGNPLIGNGTSAIGQGTRTGNTTTFATSTGTLTNGHCVSIDSSGNLVDAGGACGAGGTIYVLPSDYGMLCDGVTDETAKFQNMVNGASGKTIFIRSGLSCLISSYITLPSFTTIVGGGWNAKILTYTGNNPGFYIHNASHIVLYNFTFQGNYGATVWGSPAPSIGPIQLLMDNGQIGDMDNIQLLHLRAFGYNSSYWFQFNNINTNGYNILNIRVEGNYITTDASSVPGTTGFAANNTVFYYGGSTGSMRYGMYINNRIENLGACVGIAFFNSFSLTRIDGNIISNAGQSTPSHCISGTGTINAYGILVYDLDSNGTFGQYYTINNNIIYQPYSSGIYVVGGSSGSLAHGDIVGNNISLQQSTDNTQLPRGAIALMIQGGINVVGNVLDSNWGGVAMTGVSNGTVNVVGNKCITTVADANTSCMTIGPKASTNGTEIVNIEGNMFRVNGGAGGIYFRGSASGQKFNQYNIRSNSFSGTGPNIVASGQYYTDGIFITGNNFNNGYSNMVNLNSLTGQATVTNNIFDAQNGSPGYALFADGATALIMNGDIFLNRNSGTAMYSGVGACGVISNIQFNNVANAQRVAATSLGTANPSSCTLDQGDFVQNLVPSGTTNIVWGWMHTATSPSITHQALTFP